MPEQNKFYLEILRLVKYDNIVAIDENGDIFDEGHHLYINWDKERGPFEPRIYRRLNKSFSNPENVSISSLKRIEKFNK